jgi:HKD family nuclease
MGLGPRSWEGRVVLIPSERHPYVRSALEVAIDHHASIRAAVAFVTRSGVAELASLLADIEDVSIELTARAADVTEPEALLALRDELGADVSVVIGRHARAFHPKLWLIERPDTCIVVSGSGNLTGGGLVTNDEQFELSQYRPDDPLVAVHHERIDSLTRHAQTLDAIVNSAIWREWLDVRKKQARLQRELKRLERKINERDPMPDRAADKVQLIADLQDIYDDTVAADLPRADGERYYPTRLLVAINAARAGDRDPVKVVSDTIRRHTDGLDILLDAGRVDLTLEWLLVDDTKPYHGLFVHRSVERARMRIEEFRQAGHEIPEQAGRTTAVREIMTTDDVREHLAGLLAGRPDGFALPVLHHAHATLVQVETSHAVVQRHSGTRARIPLRLVRVRLEAVASGRRFRVSELRARNSDRFNSALGALLAALPGVEFDREDQRLYYGDE